MISVRSHRKNSLINFPSSYEELWKLPTNTSLSRHVKKPKERIKASQVKILISVSLGENG
jgi:hypothetical protein